jgi:two-component system response regulator MprA
MTNPVAGICEDDDEMRGILRDALSREGYEVRATATGTDAVRAFTERPPDVIVLDVGLPDSDGRDVCQALRARGVDAPVLFLTALGALPDRISGFHAGGDDYLTKPFAMPELLVRVRALHKRTTASAPVVRGGVKLDPVGHGLIGAVDRIALTPTEFRIMAALVSRPGEVVRRTALIAAAWPDGAIVHDNTLDAYLTRIRRKLRSVGGTASIETVRGVGYRFE